MRLAVDAANLVRDRRGMGRLARTVLAAAAREPDVTLTLLACDRDARILHDEFGGPVAHPRSAARPGTYDVVWYPFNGMRFPARAPAVVLMHDAFAFTEPARDAVARRRERAPMRRAARDAAIVTTSRWAAGEIARELAIPRARITLVRPQADAYFSPGARVLPPTLGCERFVLLVGVGERRKNARTALAACAQALRAPAELLVIAGALSDDDRRYALRCATPAVQVSPGDALLRELYRSAAAVLVPSFAEGFGLVAIEALACGAPVIASSASALPEAVAGAALLVEPGDVASWARALRRTFDDAVLEGALRRDACDFAARDRGGFAAGMLAVLRAAAAGMCADDVVDGGGEAALEGGR